MFSPSLFFFFDKKCYLDLILIIIILIFKNFLYLRTPCCSVFKISFYILEKWESITYNRVPVIPSPTSPGDKFSQNHGTCFKIKKTTWECHHELKSKLASDLTSFSTNLLFCPEAPLKTLCCIWSCGYFLSCVTTSLYHLILHNLDKLKK